MKEALNTFSKVNPWFQSGKTDQRWFSIVALRIKNGTSSNSFCGPSIRKTIPELLVRLPDVGTILTAKSLLNRLHAYL